MNDGRPLFRSQSSQLSTQDVPRKGQGLSRGFVHLGFVGVVGEIAPYLDVAADPAAHLDKGLHDDRAVVADLAQRRPDLVPVQPACAGYAPVVLTGMEVPEQRAGGA